jgi:hypothetical protein
MSLNDSINDMDDSVGGKDVKCDHCGGSSLGGDSDHLGIPEHRDLLAASCLDRGGALGNVLRLKEKIDYSKAKINIFASIK